MIASAVLLADLKRRLALLEADLRGQSEDPEVAWSTQLRAEHALATERGRTALTWSAWRDGEVAQAGVAWILASTFVRFCEDNHLLDGHPTAGRAPVWIAGTGDRTARAVEHQQAHYEDRPTDNSRDWLLVAFRGLAELPAGRGLVDPDHNPVWRAPISAPAADALLAFWREHDDNGSLRRDFTDPDLGTRFLGDLYQDLSVYAKKTYALLQTPVFVEEFILDRTLTPAMAEFGLAGLKLIDPTCGSGHFLLGAFARLDAAWQTAAPNLSARERVQKALDSIHGVDLNPFAVDIARFRLTTAALQASGDTTLTAAPTFKFHLAVGDSLLGEQGVQQEFNLLGAPGKEPFAYAAEDLANYQGILTPGTYHVVVGNPPYIAVRDRALKDAYKAAYSTCFGHWVLSVPFMELFFRLARRQGVDGGAGHVGQITSNSFMKREFGAKLIEGLLSGADLVNPVDLTAVIDTSGAYIPGHGTPTVILTGRRRRPVSLTVKAVLGIRGEPGSPSDPARGLVWSEIVEHIDDHEFDGAFVTVADLPREVLAVHPWSMAGGGASDLKERLDSQPVKLGHKMARSGMFGDSHAEDVLAAPSGTFRRLGVSETDVVPAIDGDTTRDYVASDIGELFLAPGVISTPNARSESRAALWPWRTSLWQRMTFSDGTYQEAGWDWLAWHQVSVADPNSPRLVFAKIATQLHVAFVRRAASEKPGALRIELPASATESDYLCLLAILNTSTACFWLKQVSHNKGSTVDTRGARQTQAPWEDFYEFTGTKLQQFPLPSELSSERGQRLDILAQRLEASAPTAVLQRFGTEVPVVGGRTATGTQGPRTVTVSAGIGPNNGVLGTTGRRLSAFLAAAQKEWEHTRGRMIFEQEELDWHSYTLYGLIATDLTYTGSFNALTLGERAFEIVLAREIESGAEDSAWFDRHGSISTTTFPSTWPADYREVVQRRLDEIENNPHMRLVERPEYKRRWATTPWEQQQTEALRAVALDRLERKDLWHDRQGAITLSIAQIADRTRADESLSGVVELLAGSTQFDMVQTLTALLKDEAVPFVAAHRFKESGLIKFHEWQQVWDLQRREDAGEPVTIPVPPKYTLADFRSTPAWHARGRLDVPKERFIAYPGVTRAGDTSPVLGWAGWDHAERAQALARAIGDMRALGAGDDVIESLLVGLAELEPWLHQWHAELDPAFGDAPASAITSLLDHELSRMGLTRLDLNAWRPPAATRGRKARKA